jgi:hypothetical protein
MRLQANDDKILRPKLGGIVGAARPHHAFLIADQQFESVRAHRREMGPARDQTDVGARARQLDPEISTDRAGAVDADFHENLSWSGGGNFGTDHPLALSAISSQGNYLLTANFC